MNAMIERLSAIGPKEAHAQALMLFGQFVGSWDVDGDYWDDQGNHHRYIGAWHFAWVLDGAAVQDVLALRILDAGGNPADESGAGTTVRTYDPELNVWHVAWTGPSAREFCTLTARADDGDIVLDVEWTYDGDRRPRRWRFSEITPAAFLWRGTVSEDGGETSRLEQEMRCRRRRAEAP